MRRLSHKDGSWSELTKSWSKQCHEQDEDFETFMSATVPMLADQIEVCEDNRWSGVFAHESQSGAFEAIAFLNGAFIPKFQGRVLRIRHLILAPRYDFEDFSEDVYARILTDVFEDVLNISDSYMPCENVKFHFRSPADVAIFRNFAEFLNDSDRFSSVKMVGAWLFVEKVLASQ